MNRTGLKGFSLALLTVASAVAFGENYLILHSSPDSMAADVRAKILVTGLIQGNVDTRGAASSIPSVSQLLAYDAVFVYSLNGFQNSAALGDNLATYADRGGGVVVAPLTSSTSGSIRITGRFASSAYSPFNGGATKQFITRKLGTIYDTQHPLMADVASFHCGSASLHNQVTLTTNAVRIADYDNGVPLVGYKQVGVNSVVGLNFFPPSNAVDSGFWLPTTDGGKLMANALKFSVGVRNVAPVALGENYTAEGGQPLSISAPGLLLNDTDADADPLTIVDTDLVTPGVQTTTSTTNGTLIVQADGSFSYTPHGGFIGTDSFTYKVTDGSIASNLVTVNISVVDTTAPSISGTPGDAIVSATGHLGATFTYSPPAAQDAVDGDVTVVATHASGATFALGTTTVTFTATDAAGNSSQASFNVTVVDVTAPVISGTQGNQIVIATSSLGAAFIYGLPTAYDAVDGAVAVSASVASGSVFALGQTTVTFTATDAAGNTAQTSFVVWVQYSASGLDTPGNDSKGHKAGAVVQVRFSLNGASAAITNATAKFLVNGSQAGSFTYDPGSGLYTTAWKTKGLPAGEYQLRLDLGDGVLRTLNVRLR